MSAKLYRVARPLEGAQTSSGEKQCRQRGRSGTPRYAVGDMYVSHAAQRSSINLCSSAPAKKGALASSGTGIGFAAVTAVLRMGLLVLVLAEDRGGVEVEDPAVARHEHVVVLGRLTRAALTARLDHALRQRREPPHVVGRQLAATGVAGQRTARSELAVGDERAALSLLAEPVVLERHQDRVRVAVVELEHVDVRQLDTRLSEGERPGFGGAGVDGGVALGARRVAGGALPEPPEVHRRLPQFARVPGRG